MIVHIGNALASKHKYTLLLRWLRILNTSRAVPKRLSITHRCTRMRPVTWMLNTIATHHRYGYICPNAHPLDKKERCPFTRKSDRQMWVPAWSRAEPGVKKGGTWHYMCTFRTQNCEQHIHNAWTGFWFDLVNGLSYFPCTENAQTSEGI